MLVSCRLTLWMNALRQSFYRLKQPGQTQWVERHGCRINLSLTMTNIPELAPETDVLLSIVVRLKRRWWSQTESNRRPPECKSGALPTELWPRNPGFPPGRMPCPALPQASMVGRGRVELPTSRLSGVRSNHLSYRPMTGQGQAHRGQSRRQAIKRPRGSLSARTGRCRLKQRTKEEKRRRRDSRICFAPQWELF